MKIKGIFSLVLGIVLLSCDSDQVFDEAEQLRRDLAQIDQFLSDNGLTAEEHESGIRYIITRTGTGDNATYGNSVEAHYTGYLLDRTEFDSSTDRGPFTFVLGRGDVIPGWDIGFSLLNKGAAATLLIPSSLGYGNNRSGDIPPNSILIFDVEVLDIR